MKYLIILSLVILLGCTNTERAGSLYKPELYQKMLAEKNKSPIIKNGTVAPSYHSALGDLCTRYNDNNNESLICSNGTTEKQVRVLQ